VYQAPEQGQVYALMEPAVTSAGELRTTFDTMARHLDTYASALTRSGRGWWPWSGGRRSSAPM
jgi:hypothetical protein